MLVYPIHKISRNLIEKRLFNKTTHEIAEENERLIKEIGEKEKFKAMGTLAGGIAHEIKNPLQAIKTFTEYLPQKMSDKDFLDKFASLVGKEVDRIDDLVRQLLNYSKPRELKRERTEMIKLLDDTIEILSNKCVSQKIHIQKSLKPTRLFLLVDPHLVRQALFNILLNAIEVMPHGGKLDIHSNVRDDFFSIEITDTGGGIPKEHLRHIFDPFFTSKNNSTGLGLSITKSIMTQHNGHITARNIAPGKTCFKIKIPVTHDE